MTTTAHIKAYINSLPEAKAIALETLHTIMLKSYPKAKLWFLDGKDENGKVVSNPNIGYGMQTIKYANGSSKAFYKIGISANSSGISVYILGLNNKKYLPETYGKIIGKATVTSYCIKFKSLDHIHINHLQAAIDDGMIHLST